MNEPAQLPPGIRAVVRDLAEDPGQGIEQNLAVETQPIPDVSTLQPDDILVAIRASAVSWVDVLMTSGQYQHIPTLPYTPGLEYAGTVAWKGPNIPDTRFRLGDKVYVACFTTGPRSSGNYQSYGGFASYAVAPVDAVSAMPENFTYDQACNFAGNFETAYHCLVDCGHLQPGETILIHGASGATGLAAVQIAKTLGATVIATGRSLKKLKQVQEHGADHIISLARDDAEPGIKRFREEVKALTAGKGVNVVYDSVGGDISLESLRCVSFGARFLIVGWASTPLVAKGKGGRGSPNANLLPTNLIMMKGLKVLGCPMVISTQNNPAIRPPRVAKLKEWAEAGKISPYISHVFELRNAKDAMAARWNGDILGGCVVRPPPLPFTG
ncbi:MAG: NADPH:quinone oxidoreductase family protein [Myxococcota bacterium]|nr:NADPH:quinone oxidoreductase family protein [Myxococcota bacterium]